MDSSSFSEALVWAAWCHLLQYLSGLWATSTHSADKKKPAIFFFFCLEQFCAGLNQLTEGSVKKPWPEQSRQHEGSGVKNLFFFSASDLSN